MTGRGLTVPEQLVFERAFVEQLLAYLLSKPAGEVLGFIDHIREHCQQAAIEAEVNKQAQTQNGAANQQ